MLLDVLLRPIGGKDIVEQDRRTDQESSTGQGGAFGSQAASPFSLVRQNSSDDQPPEECEEPAALTQAPVANRAAAGPSAAHPQEAASVLSHWAEVGSEASHDRELSQRSSSDAEGESQGMGMSSAHLHSIAQQAHETHWI